MLCIAVRYLCGWAMATADGAVKQRPEWPPHPDRLFMALTAAHYQGDRDPEGEEALRWLERQGAPAISCSAATHREVVTHYVPVNDTVAPTWKNGRAPSPAQVKKGLSLLPDHRSRQPRQFPVVIPADPHVYFTWHDAQPKGHRGPLERLCRGVVSLGHSASLVQVWWVEREPSGGNPPGPTLAPTRGVGERRLRVPGRGRLAYLRDCYNESARRDYAELERRRGESKGKALRAVKAELADRFPDGAPRGLRPAAARAVDYRHESHDRPHSSPIESIFDHRLLILRRIRGHGLGLESTLLLTEAFHKTLLSRTANPIPEWISGHKPNGGPTNRAHLAMLPLPHIDHAQADGHLLGLALAIPREVAVEDVRTHLDWLLRYDQVGDPVPVDLYRTADLGWKVALEQNEFPPRALTADTWTRPASRWATVTPMVFDRHPKKAHREAQLADMAALACERIGLPSPTRVTFDEVSPFLGVPHRRGFPPLLRKSDGGRMHHGHVTLRFSAPVRGPILIGAGRFRGYGLCRPCPMTGEE